MELKRSYLNVIYTIWDISHISLDRYISTIKSRLSLHLQQCQVDKGFITTGECHFKARKAGSIQIGKNVHLLAGWRSNRVGLTNPVLIQTLGDGMICIGSYFGGSAIVLSARTKIEIGEYVGLGANVRMFDHDFHALNFIERRPTHEEEGRYLKSEPITIEDDVFIGTNAIILKGVTIGQRTIVAAGSVVFRGSYPADSILAGNPARVISQIKTK